MIAQEGDTGSYLQYAHARLCSITRKVDMASDDLSRADLSLLTEPAAANIVRTLSLWPQVVSVAYQTHEPSAIVAYLFRLGHATSSSYKELRVLGSSHELQMARLALYESTRQVLSNGMKLLGLTPLDR